MTIESIIAAKVRLIQVDSLASIWVSGAFVFASLCLGLYAWRNGRRNSDLTFLLSIIGGLLGLISLTVLGSSVYTYKTAEIQATADVVNYRLVELKGAP